MDLGLVQARHLPVTSTRIAQISRGMKRMKPPNAVDRRRSNSVWPISIPAMLQLRKIRMIPKMTIQIRGHRRCNPYLLNVTTAPGVRDFVSMSVLCNRKQARLMFRSLFLFVLRGKISTLRSYFFVLVKEKKRKEKEEKENRSSTSMKWTANAIRRHRQLMMLMF